MSGVAAGRLSRSATKQLSADAQCAPVRGTESGQG
jgi:hypothetical protein